MPKSKMVKTSIKIIFSLMFVSIAIVFYIQYSFKTNTYATNVNINKQELLAQISPIYRYITKSFISPSHKATNTTNRIQPKLIQYFNVRKNKQTSSNTNATGNHRSNNITKNIKVSHSDIHSSAKKELHMNTDIVVYGGGASGVMAAYQAAVLGKKVILIEPTDWLGGQASTTGVGSIDSGLKDFDFKLGYNGKWLYYVQKIYKSHGLPSNQIYAQCIWTAPTPPNGHICIDPYINNQAFKLLLNSKDTKNNITILYRTDIYNDSPLIKINKQIRGIKVKNYLTGKYYTIHSKVVIDASEYGDLIPYSGAAFFFRNSPFFRTKQEALTWVKRHITSDNVRIQDITYVADMRLKSNYLPTSIRNLYTYKIADLHPEFYPSGQMLKFFKTRLDTGLTEDKCAPSVDKVSKRPWGFYFHARYRALGDPYIPYYKMGFSTCKDKNGNILKVKNVSKFGVNYINSPKTNALFLLDRKERKKHICDAKELTLKFIAYAEKLKLPDGVENKWYLSREGHTCNNSNCYNLKEGNCVNIPDDIEKYMYLGPYVRESLRPAGLINTNTNKPVLRWNQVTRFNNKIKTPYNVLKTDSVSIAGYAFDVHDTSDKQLLKIPISYRRHGPIQLPLGIFIPTNGKIKSPSVIKGFLVAEKNLAVDRYVQGAIRVHPYVMLNGQVAGVLAVLATRYNGDTSQITATQVQNLVTSPKVKGKISPYIYSDINYTEYNEAYRYSELMSALGIFMGNNPQYYKGKWLPNRLVKRGELALVVQRLANRASIDLSKFKSRTYNNNFKDIQSSPYKTAIQKLYEARIINGCKKDLFCVNSYATSNQTLVILHNLLKLKPQTLRSQNICINYILPKTINSSLRPIYINLMKAGILEVKNERGICKVQYFIDKCKNNYLTCNIPNKPITRLEASKFIWASYYSIKTRSH